MTVDPPEVPRGGLPHINCPEDKVDLTHRRRSKSILVTTSHQGLGGKPLYHPKA